MTKLNPRKRAQTTSDVLPLLYNILVITFIENFDKYTIFTAKSELNGAWQRWDSEDQACAETQGPTKARVGKGKFFIP